MFWIPSAMALPSVDAPLKTGAKAPADAAVVIGIESYPLLGRDVPYAEADARAVADTLIYTRGIPLGRVHVLTRGTTREDILAAVQDLGDDVRSGGTLFIYFAGHGAASGKSRTLLGADVKATTDSFAARGVPTNELSILGSKGGGQVVMLVDACFGGAGRDGAELVPGTRWLVPVDPEEGQWAATIENQVAAPLPEAGHGLFTWLAVGAMRGWADGELSGKRDGEVTADEAQAWVVSALRTMGRKEQTPSLSADLDGFRLTRGVSERIDGSVLAGLWGGSVGVPAATSATATGFGDLSLDVTAKVRQQECDQEGLRLGAAARSAKLDAAVKAASAEASAAWGKLAPQARACEALDAASLTECVKTVDAFVARAEGLKVSLPAGVEPVKTACGTTTPAFAADSRSVAVAELSAAKTQASRLKAALGSAATATRASGAAATSSTKSGSAAKPSAQECEAEALRLGAAARAAKLENEAKKAADAAGAAWVKLAAEAKACEVQDATGRAKCAERVDAFITRAESLTVTLPEGEEEVLTKCGTAHPAFGRGSRGVSVAELEPAKVQWARLAAAPAARSSASAKPTEKAADVSPSRVEAPAKVPEPTNAAETTRVAESKTMVKAGSSPSSSRRWFAASILSGAPLIQGRVGWRSRSRVVVGLEASSGNVSFGNHDGAEFRVWVAGWGPFLDVPIGERGAFHAEVGVGYVTDGPGLQSEIGYVHRAPTGFTYQIGVAAWTDFDRGGAQPNVGLGYTW